METHGAPRVTSALNFLDPVACCEAFLAAGVMEVITLSSDSEEDGSDVEIIAQYSNFLSRADPLPQQGGKVCADAPNVNAPVVRLEHGLLQLHRNLPMA